MAVRQEDIIGRRIVRIWACPIDQVYQDHLVELDSGVLVKFSWGELELGNLSNYPGGWEDNLCWDLCAPARGDPVPTCSGCRIERVLYSLVPYVNTSQLHRAQVYLVLDDGR